MGDQYLYSTFQVSVFQFTDNFLGSYQASFNAIADVTTEETTSETFYRDVVMFQTFAESTGLHRKPGEKLELAKSFSLVTSSGNRTTAALTNPTLRAARVVDTESDRAVHNIRAMLRQYKVVAQEVQAV